jgi:hypothetical protein
MFKRRFWQRVDLQVRWFALKESGPGLDRRFFEPTRAGASPNLSRSRRGGIPNQLQAGESA